MADQQSSEYRDKLSVFLKASSQTQAGLAELARLAHQLGREDEAERLERLCGLAEGLEDGLRDITREVDGITNPGRLTRIIVADVGVPQACLRGQHRPAPRNPRRCLYCRAFPLERFAEDARRLREARASLGLVKKAEPEERPKGGEEDSRG